MSTPDEVARRVRRRNAERRKRNGKARSIRSSRRVPPDRAVRRREDHAFAGIDGLA